MHNVGAELMQNASNPADPRKSFEPLVLFDHTLISFRVLLGKHMKHYAEQSRTFSTLSTPTNTAYKT